MSHKAGKLRVGLKYCGGCNPEYDRVALASRIKNRLDGKVAFVSPDRGAVDLILAVEGCSTACADLSAFQGLEIRTITSMGDGENIVREITEAERL